MHNFKTGEWTVVAFPEPVYAVYPGGTPDFDSTTYRYNYQSLITPPSVFDYDTRGGKSTLSGSIAARGLRGTRLASLRLRLPAGFAAERDNGPARCSPCTDPTAGRATSQPNY